MSFPVDPAAGPRLTRRKALAWALGTLGAAAFLAAVYFFRWVMPNDERVPFPVPESTSSLAESLAFDFLRSPAARYKNLLPGALPSPPPAPSMVVLGGPSTVARLSLTASQASEFEFSLVLPPQARLEFYYGVASPAGVSAPGITFAVHVTAAGQSHVAFSDSVAPRERAPRRLLSSPARLPDDPWRRASVPLSQWAGQWVTVRFRTEPLPSSHPDPNVGPASQVVAAWGQPGLWAAAPPASDNVVLLVLESMPEGEATENVRRLVYEGVQFQRVYTNSLRPGSALNALLASAPPPFFGGVPPAFNEPAPPRAPLPTLPSTLAAHKYQTILVGPASLQKVGGPLFNGFNEVHLFASPGYETVHTLRRVVDWLGENKSQGPFCLVVYLGDTGGVPPPLSFWTQAAGRTPLTKHFLRRWKTQAQAAYRDNYARWLFDVMDIYELWNRAAAGVVSLGVEGASAPAEPFAEVHIRAFWALKHRSLPPGQAVAETTELLDVAPTLLQMLRLPPAPSFEGLSYNVTRHGFGREDAPPTVYIDGDGARALLNDNHYKYIRRDGGTFPFEELYDLWTDPNERINLIRARRPLLVHLRQKMDMHAPRLMETKLLFHELNEPVRGSVYIPDGLLRAQKDAESPFSGLSRQYDFEVTGASGVVRFQTWPPQASFILQLRLGPRAFPLERYRVSRYALPLMEPQSTMWFDANKFSWMEGWGEPRLGETGPLVFVGREPVTRAIPSGVRAAPQRPPALPPPVVPRPVEPSTASAAPSALPPLEPVAPPAPSTRPVPSPVPVLSTPPAPAPSPSTSTAPLPPPAPPAPLPTASGTALP